MAKETAIKLSEDFKIWLDSVGRKGETYEDVIKAIIFKLPPEKFEEMLKKHDPRTRRMLQIKILRHHVQPMHANDNVYQLC